MKQGTGKSMMGATKVEPKPKAVSVDRVAALGQQTVRTRAPSPMFKSEGYKAPMMGQTRHKSGSQGKH